MVRGITGVFVLLAGFACNKLEEVIPTTADFEMTDQTLVVTGTFSSNAHTTTGTASIFEKDGVKTLLIENFMTDNGPDLNVYMATGTDATSYIDLGDLKGTQGSLSYTLPSEFDHTAQPFVLIWCVQFSVLFGNAELQ